MSNKHAVTQCDLSDYGQPAAGHVQQSENAPDTSFNPTELEHATAARDDAGPDPFDPASLRLSQDFAASLGVKKALLAVPVRKPDKSWFVRVHPDPAYRPTGCTPPSSS